jgi:hypothetical protein
MKLSFSAFVISAIAALFVSQTALADICNKASIKENSLYVLGPYNQPIALKKGKKFGTFVLDDRFVDPDTKLKFVGKFGDQKDDDVMVAVKILGTTNTVSKQTEIVYLHRPAMLGKREFRKTGYSLERYNKHHYSENKSNDSVLHHKFHLKYKVNGKARRTDDGESRDAFVFSGVQNNYRGGIIAQLVDKLIGPSRADDSPRYNKKKIVYLHAEIRNLRPDPCFEFSTNIGENVNSLTITLDPIDPSQRNIFWPRPRFNLEK